jgi:hypothetical protein
MVHITKNRKLKYLPTGLSLHPKHWNPLRKEVRKSYPDFGRDSTAPEQDQTHRRHAHQNKQKPGTHHLKQRHRQELW